MARIQLLTILLSLPGLLGANIGNVSSLSLPLVDKMSASLTANIDITDMKTVVKDYIDKLVKKGVEASMNDSIASVVETMEKKFDTKTKYQTLQKDVVKLRTHVERIEDLMKDTLTSVGEDDLPTECSDPKIKNKINKAGIYTVSPDGRTRFRVRCEPEGWTVIQRRYDGSTKFYRNWTDYEDGFGDLNGEFWLGNKYIALLTANGTHELKVNLSDGVESRYAKYSTFKVGDSSTKYALYIGGYTGNAGNGMEYHNKQAFSTFDQDNDKSSSNCASHPALLGAWWYKDCWRSSLNGKYVPVAKNGGGIKWITWKGPFHALGSSSMMICKHS